MIRLKELRQKNGLSQQALADKFTLSQQSIYKYEHGLAEPDIDTLKKLAGLFNVSIDYLVGYCDSDNTENAFESTGISAEEMNLILEIRNLPADVRSSLIRIVKYMQNIRTDN